ncbi:hypothetical protein QZN11_15850 [Streptomyces gramineus]|uniref:hypothetical protein n=1 Tax=Streptomyces gramineus TaxID=910542 RepID=UPI00398BA593
MLRLAAEHADVVAFAGARPAPGSTVGRLEPATARELDERVARYARSAADRAEPDERNLPIQLVTVTDDPRSALGPLLARRPEQTLARALALPTVLVGTLEEVTGRVRGLRERYGIPYLTAPEPYLEALAPVRARLAGDS